MSRILFLVFLEVKDQIDAIFVDLWQMHADLEWDIWAVENILWLFLSFDITALFIALILTLNILSSDFII
jgi:hypothetical protein